MTSVGVYIPVEIWTQIIEICAARWRRKIFAKRPSTDRAFSLMMCPEQRAACAVCRNWAVSLRAIPKHLHLNVHEISDEFRALACQLRALSRVDRVLPVIDSVPRFTLSTSTTSVRTAKGLSRTVLAPAIREIKMFSGGGGVLSPGNYLSSEMQGVCERFENPRAKIRIQHMAWPPPGDHLVSPFFFPGENRDFIIRFLSRVKAYGPNVWNKVHRSICEPIYLAELINMVLKVVGQPVSCSQIRPEGGFYWDLRKFHVQHVTLYVRRSVVEGGTDALLPIVPACKKLTLTAGSNFVCKKRFCSRTRFFDLKDDELVPPNYMHLKQFEEVHLQHIEIADFDLFRAQFPNLKKIRVGKRVQGLGRLHVSARMAGVQCFIGGGSEGLE